LTRLKKEVEELKGEKIKLNSNLYDLRHNYASLKRDHEGIVKKQKKGSTLSGLSKTWRKPMLSYQ